MEQYTQTQVEQRLMMSQAWGSFEKFLKSRERRDIDEETEKLNCAMLRERVLFVYLNVHWCCSNIWRVIMDIG